MLQRHDTNGNGSIDTGAEFDNFQYDFHQNICGGQLKKDASRDEIREGFTGVRSDSKGLIAFEDIEIAAHVYARH